MIKLTNPLMHNGRMIPAGSVIALPEEFEQAVLAAGNGVKAEPAPAPPDAPIPDEKKPAARKLSEEEQLELLLGR